MTLKKAILCGCTGKTNFSGYIQTVHFVEKQHKLTDPLQNRQQLGMGSFLHSYQIYLLLYIRIIVLTFYVGTMV